MSKILIVDDSPELLEFFPFFLQKYNHECSVAASAADVFKQLEKTAPQIIIIDVLMGGEDGRAICRQLKLNESYKQIPVILMSGTPAKLADYTSCFADDILEKPFNIHTVLSKINKFDGCVA